MPVQLQLAAEGTTSARVRAVDAADPVFAQCVAMATLAGFTQFRAAIARRPERWFVLEEREPGGPWRIVASVGAWAPGRLDSERHLADGAEDDARRLGGRPVARSRMVELGAIVGGLPGRPGRLLRLVPALLLGEGVDLALVMASERLRRILDAAEVPFHPAAPARPERVPADELPHWGRFFDARPVVGWIPLAESVARHALWLEAMVTDAEPLPAARPASP